MSLEVLEACNEWSAWSGQDGGLVVTQAPTWTHVSPAANFHQMVATKSLVTCSVHGACQDVQSSMSNVSEISYIRSSFLNLLLLFQDENTMHMCFQHPYLWSPVSLTIQYPI